MSGGREPDVTVDSILGPTLDPIHERPPAGGDEADIDCLLGTSHTNSDLSEGTNDPTHHLHEV